MYKSKKLIRLKQVTDLTGKSRSAVYRDMAAGDFPANIRTGENTVAWLESDVIDWINQRIAESKGDAA